ETETIAATGAHTYGDWVVTKEATCTDAGSREKTCSVCGNTTTEAISALGHDYIKTVVAATCTTAGYTSYTCSRCGNTYVGDRTSATGHSFDENGVCTVCGYTKVDSISFVDTSTNTVNADAGTILIISPVTLAEFSAEIAAGTWTVTAADGTAVTDEDAVGTGYSVSNSTGTTYLIILKGDVNGDGKVNASDARLTLRTAAMLETLESVYFSAGDLDASEKISASEARTILRVAAKLENF
ncbi:MAG: dockerin type I repeat-containing protein, partial [Clostridiales bacterium]|nr:dockerin type I repeat-containing protein [Clostridiales bacterium]